MQLRALDDTKQLSIDWFDIQNLMQSIVGAIRNPENQLKEPVFIDDFKYGISTELGGTSFDDTTFYLDGYAKKDIVIGKYTRLFQCKVKKLVVADGFDLTLLSKIFGKYCYVAVEYFNANIPMGDSISPEFQEAFFAMKYTISTRGSLAEKQILSIFEKDAVPAGKYSIARIVDYSEEYVPILKENAFFILDK
jgi:hypothetical protein